MDNMLHALFFYPFDKRGFDGMLTADILTLSGLDTIPSKKNFFMEVLLRRTSEVCHIASSSCMNKSNKS